MADSIRSIANHNAKYAHLKDWKTEDLEKAYQHLNQPSKNRNREDIKTARLAADNELQLRSRKR